MTSYDMMYLFGQSLLCKYTCTARSESDLFIFSSQKVLITKREYFEFRGKEGCLEC